MTLRPSVAQLQQKHVVLELESIDRLYLNGYIPQLTTVQGMAGFIRHHLGHRFASTKSVEALTRDFVQRIQEMIQEQQIPLVRFSKGVRKDDVMKERLRQFKAEEGVVFVGVAQEKCAVPRTVRKTFANGANVPWLVMSTAMVNVYYFYCKDRDFGPFFIKFCSYFPYGIKLCLNGHEYLKQQLAQRGVAFEALDNGLLGCADLALAQKICANLNAEKIDRMFRKWLRRLPHPYSTKTRRAGYRYQLSIWQAEFSLTQVWDKPAHGREFFEQVIRENIDLGRPENVQLIFRKKMHKSTVRRGTCRTRIITEGVEPSLHFYYRKTHLKQYHKEGRALRTETTINDTYDFQVGRKLHNLDALRPIGFGANRRLLKVQTLRHDPQVGANHFARLQQPLEVAGQHIPALRFGDPRVQSLLAVLILFVLQPRGFRHKELRPLLAQHRGLDPERLTPNQISYDLRRLRGHGLIERLPKSHRYQLTDQGLKVAYLYQHTLQRVIRPALSKILDPNLPPSSPLQRAFQNLHHHLDSFFQEKIAA
jgi:hypothetical protein